MPKTKIVIIGLDGVSWDILIPLIQKGALPAFAELMRRGAYGTLISPPPCRSATGIATFYTGKNSCKWGLFDFPSFEPDVISYEKVRKKSQSFWDILGEKGYKSAIMNLPGTFPPSPVEGVMISGFSISEDQEYTYPKDFKEKVRGFHSEREIFLKLIQGTIRIGRTKEKSKELIDFYIKNVKKRYGLIKNIIKSDEFDFSMFWIDESDAVCHEAWGNEELLLYFFKEIDNILKDIAENNLDSNIIIMSDHGFGPSPTHEFFPKTWLKNEGYLKMNGNRFQQWLIQKMNTIVIERPYPYRYWHLERIYSLYNKIKKWSKRTAAGPKKQNWRAARGGRAESRAIGIDWAKTVATNQDFWGIRIIRENLERDYDGLRGEIIKKMRDLKDEGGEKIIKNVWKREEMFSGPDIQRFPDIVYLPVSKFEPTGFLPFCIAKKKTRTPSFPGDHLTANRAIFIAAGPNINQAGEIEDIEMADIAPTVLGQFNVAAPEDMDGRVLKEIIK